MESHPFAASHFSSGERAVQPLIGGYFFLTPLPTLELFLRSFVVVVSYSLPPGRHLARRKAWVRGCGREGSWYLPALCLGEEAL